MRINYINYANLWPPIIRTQNHMNGTDVINTLSEGGGSWGHGGDEEYHKNYVYHSNISSTRNYVKAVEMQYYSSTSKNLIVGYIKNRTYNIYSLSNPGSKCKVLTMQNKSPINTPWNIKWKDIQLGKRIRATNLLPDTKYFIDFYSFSDGNYISSTSKFANTQGNLKIKYPELITHDNTLNPVIWFVAKGYEKNEITKNSNNIITEKEIIKNEIGLDSIHITGNNINSSRVYPIPFEESLTIESQQNDIIIISDMLGNDIAKYKVISGVNHIDTKEYLIGIYYLRFIEQNIKFKIWKE